MLADADVETSDDDCDNNENLTPESSPVKEQKNELIKTEKEYTHEKELAKKCFDQLPQEFQKLFGKYHNDILLAMLSAIDDLANDDCETKSIKRRTDEAIEFFQNYIACLQEYKGDQETCNNIIHDVYKHYYHKRCAKTKRLKMLKIGRLIKNN
ncbi:MAG: hypothetical protein D4R41_05415 [Sediminibacterium sp.]|nr:MAG: hypothetical protein D4R41_05415 [Sediminibacterium sp.]